jgi:phosphoribosylanthranilate isomerase
MMVKICGITRREDAEAAVAAGASAIGFIFYPPSPRYIAPERAAEITSGLPITKVGVFVNESAASIDAVMRAANLDVAQLYGGETPAATRVWQACRIDPEQVYQAFEWPAGAEAVLLDGPKNGESYDWTLARSFPAPRIILAGGLDASNVAEAIRVAQPWGVDASSLLEISPGIKDHEKVRLFVEAALKAQ